MGTFRTRIKKKGKRWIKGQSSNSNPSTNKFRTHAKNNFFKEDVSGKNHLFTLSKYFLGNIIISIIFKDLV